LRRSTKAIQTLEVVLTAACNLRCLYCYQNDKKARRLSWDRLRGALDLLLRSPRRQLDVVFLGGEPLLRFPLIRQAVDYVRAARPRGRTVRYTLVTNGILLGKDHAAFLDQHRARVQLSFDGVPAAQALRGRWTFPVLDQLIDRLRFEQPRLFRERLCVSLTLTAATLPYLGDSIAYFLRKGVPEIAVSPVVTHDAGWQNDMVRLLDEQLSKVYDACRQHFRRCGEVPLLLFRRDRERRARRRPAGAMCRAPEGRTIALDVDGRLYGCAAFAESYQTFPSPFLRERASKMRLGAIGSPGFAPRLARYPQAARGTGLFDGKRDKYSAFGRCCDCRFLSSCSICPVSIGHVPGNTDPRRVPDFACAFNQVALTYRDRFLRRSGALALLRISESDWRRIVAIASRGPSRRRVSRRRPAADLA
jgi:sulfatase maturation enzyme AslB (radical SAM superfamily)